MADRLILLVPDGADTLIQLLSNQMQAYIGDSSLNIPFEMQAFEAIFGTVIEIQKLHLSDLEARIKKVSRILRKYSIVPVEVQEKVQQFKQRVSEMIERARGHKRILEELLEEDDHLALMALTLLKDKPYLYK
jgi:DNA repair ATPase RecN